MKVQFLGGVRTVTGSATLLEKDSIEWLVDCGMYQGGRTLEERNRNLRSYHAENLAFILLTHAHIDHSGLIPKLVSGGRSGPSSHRLHLNRPKMDDLFFETGNHCSYQAAERAILFGRIG